MEWLPSLNIKENDNEFLNDFEFHKVKELQRSMRDCSDVQERRGVEKEIYKIYLEAIRRRDSESKKTDSNKIWDDLMQKTFDQMTRIIVSLFLTLSFVSSVAIFFSILVLFTSPSYKIGLTILMYAIVPTGIFGIIMGLVLNNKLLSLKRKFESGEL